MKSSLCQSAMFSHFLKNEHFGISWFWPDSRDMYIRKTTQVTLRSNMLLERRTTHHVEPCSHVFSIMAAVTLCYSEELDIDG